MKNLREVGVDNATFEVDYPHTDSTWPQTEGHGPRRCSPAQQEEIYKLCRGKRDQDAASRQGQGPLNDRRFSLTRFSWSPAEIAEAAVWLCSGRSSFATGAGAGGGRGPHRLTGRPKGTARVSEPDPGVPVITFSWGRTARQGGRGGGDACDELGLGTVVGEPDVPHA